MGLSVASAVPQPQPVALVLADRHPLMLDAMEYIFQRPAFDVVARCTTREQAVAAVRTHKPDVLVFDHELPPDGFDVMREVKRQSLPTRGVVFTSHLSEARAQEAMRLGVCGVVLKDAPSDLLVQCVRKVHAGERWVERHSTGRLLEKLVRREVAVRQLAKDLTTREIEIVRLVASGLRNKQIAERLFVSEGTIKIHLHNIYKKLEVSNRLALMVYAQDKGVV